MAAIGWFAEVLTVSSVGLLMQLDFQRMEGVAWMTDPNSEVLFPELPFPESEAVL